MKSNISIAIVHCYYDSPYGPGAKNVYASENANEIKSIRDLSLGDYLELDRYEDKRIRLLSYRKNGVCVCSFKRSQNRDSEYLASIVFFPIELNLSGLNMVKVIEEVERNVNESSEKDECFNPEFLTELCDKYASTPKEQEPYFRITMQQKGYALRYVGGEYENLAEVLERGYQSEFAKYEWVILAPKEDINIKDRDAIKDITSIKLKTSSIFKLTEDYGFLPYLDGELFDKPIRICEGDKISVVWKKKGYAEIEKEGSTEADFKINPSDIKKIFKRSNFSFYFYDDNRNKCPLKNIKPDVLHIDVAEEDDEKFKILESKLSLANITVNCEGYKQRPINANKINLQKIGINDTIDIILEKERYKNLVYVTLYIEGKPYHFKPEEIITKNQLTSDRVRFDNYRVKGEITQKDHINITIEPNKRDNLTEKKGKGKPPIPIPEPEPPKQPIEKPWYCNITTWIAIVLITIILGAIGYIVYDWVFPSKQAEDATCIGTVEVETDNDNQIFSSVSGMRYLDTKTKYIRKEMENDPELIGLYDLINEYKFDELKKFLYQHSDVAKSIQMKKLIDLINKGAKGGTIYSNNGTFTIDDYLQKLSSEINRQISE